MFHKKKTKKSAKQFFSDSNYYDRIIDFKVTRPCDMHSNNFILTAAAYHTWPMFSILILHSIMRNHFNVK